MKILVSILFLLVLTGCYPYHLTAGSGAVLTDQHKKGNPIHHSLHEMLVNKGIIEKEKK